jgi:pimeloyl-ACP methyl ester carboxylesterase
MDRIDVAFPPQGSKCAAWLYYPTDSDCDVACVVMAHGFSLTRHDGLVPYAESLARGGVAVLVYDHRFIGDSEGEPRQRIQPSEQLEDRRSAVAFARTLDRIDPNRIIVWGYSMSAGTALIAAATDPRIAGAILLCPLLDGQWRSNRGLWTQPRNAAWITAHAIKDILGNAVVPVAAQPGRHGVLTFPCELDGFHSITGPGSPWRNEIRAAPVPGYSLYRPLTNARKLNCPTLIQAGDRDVTISPRAIDKLAQRVTNAVVKRYDIDHFQPFHEDHATRIAADQTEWLNNLNSASEVDDIPGAAENLWQ